MQNLNDETIQSDTPSMLLDAISNYLLIASMLRLRTCVYVEILKKKISKFSKFFLIKISMKIKFFLINICNIT